MCVHVVRLPSNELSLKQQTVLQQFFKACKFYMLLTDPIIVGKGSDEVLGDGLGGAQLCDAHRVPMIHHNHHMLSLRLNGG